MDVSRFQKGISGCVSIVLGGIDSRIVTEELSNWVSCRFS